MDSFFALQSAVAGRYSLVREIGRGGMAIVFLARDVALDRPVAIKLLPPSLADRREPRERFLREARTVAQLSHPNIVPIHAVEEREGLVYFVMSFVDGRTLGDRVRAGGPLAPRDATRVLQEVAWALAHAHARGIVHRDVKPDNVLLDAETDRAVVTDFGIAAAVGAVTPRSGTALGTPLYVSPEQARGEETGPLADVYSLGVTAWYALTGRTPFEGGSVADLLRRHATETPPPLLSVRSDVPLALARIVDRCLAKRPEDRPASAEALAAELGASQARATLVAAPVRAYLRAARTASGEVTTAVAISALSYAGALLAPAGGAAGDVFRVVAALLGTASLLVGGAVVALHARSIRALTRRGFDVAAVERAATIEAATEDESAPRARPARSLAIAAGGAVLTVDFALLGARASSFGPGFLGILSSIVTGVLTVGAVLNALNLRGRARPTGLFSRLQRVLFTAVGVRNVPRAVTDGEATVVALGGAIQDVWAGLPAQTRAALDDVPRLAARLETEAVRLRAGSDDPGAGERLRTVVAAMEAVRLDLLRLAAGAAGVGDVTAQLDAARRVGEQVDALEAGRQEARRTEVTPPAALPS